MNVAAPQSRLARFIYGAYVAAFLVYLVAPLIAAGVFAFNNSMFPTLPWKGFTLGWFFGNSGDQIGMFHDERLLDGLLNSVEIGLMVAALSVVLGTCNAFLFERCTFPGKRFLYIVMIIPLVIPGVILGISILLLASMVANWASNSLNIEIDTLRPGVFLIVLGQTSFLTTITSLVIAARLGKFDISLEEAAFNLGASRFRALRTVTLPYIMPAVISAFIVAFLVSFENFNTTVMLVGSKAPLTITMYDRMVRVGSTPVLNAVSFFLMIASGGLAVLSLFVQREKAEKPTEPS
jgi:spermidine/putrescine transport system permease protein